MIKPTCPWHIPNSVAWVNWRWKDLWSGWPGNISQLAPRLFIIVDENSVISNKLAWLITTCMHHCDKENLDLLDCRWFVTGSSRWQGLNAKISWWNCVHCTQLRVWIFIALARNVPVHEFVMKLTLTCSNHSIPSKKEVDSCMELLAWKSAIKTLLGCPLHLSWNFPQIKSDL